MGCFLFKNIRDTVSLSPSETFTNVFAKYSMVNGASTAALNSIQRFF